MSEVRRETTKKITETVGTVRVEKTILRTNYGDSIYYGISKDGYAVQLSEAEAVEANAMLYRLIEAS